MMDIQEIPPEQINWSSPNIRGVLAETGDLAASIKAHGQLEPGTGWWEGDRFRLATGHRRANACRRLGISFLACIIAPLDGAELVEYQLVENIQTEALPPSDLEKAVATLMDVHGNHRTVGERLGMSPQWVSTIIGAGKAREALDSWNENAEVKSMSTSTASLFGRLKNDENRQAAFAEALSRNKGDENLSGRLVRKVVDEYAENEIRDVEAYLWKLKQERVKLVRKRADIEVEIDRIDAKIARLSKR